MYYSVNRIGTLAVEGIEAGTPGSDIILVYPDALFDVIWGRNGNDAILGFDPGESPAKQAVDLMIGDLQETTEGFEATGKDRFILGDWHQPYYVDHSTEGLGGNQFFALILDFQPELDLIQLHGSPNDYSILEFGGNTALFSRQLGDSLDLVAIVLDTSGLNLSEDYFQFEGKLPAPVAIEEIGQLGTSGYDEITTVELAQDGGVYLGGYSSGSLGGTSQGGSDIWFGKYDKDGEQQWIKQLGSDNADSLWDIATDEQGNLYLVGLTSGELATTNPDTTAPINVWIGKYDNQGNQQWTRQLGGSGLLDASIRIDIAPDGQTFSLSGVSINQSQDSSDLPFWNPWVGQYSTFDGSEVWYDDQFGSFLPDESYALAVDDRGHVFASGWTYGDMGGANAGKYDVWLAKFDPLGEQEWIRQFGSESFEFAWGLDTDREGNAYVGGWTSGNLSSELAGLYDGLIAKYDTNGSRLWVKQFGSFGDDEISNLFLSEDDYLYVTGFTNGELVGDDLASESGNDYDAFAAKYDLEGNLVWMQQFGSSGTEQARSIVVDSLLEKVYVTGITDSSLGARNQGSFDGWVAQLDAINGELVNFSFNNNFDSL